MVYVVEITFNTKRCKSPLEALQSLDELCNKYECLDHYHITETRDRKYNYDSVYVYTCKFPDDEDSNDTNSLDTNIYNNINLTSFIKKVKSNKQYSIDVVFRDFVKLDIIYVSPYYLRNMMHENRKDYLTRQRERSYSESDYFILREFKHELSKYNAEFVKKNESKFTMSYQDYLTILEGTK